MNEKQVESVRAQLEDIQKEISEIKSANTLDKDVASAVLERLDKRLRKIDIWRNNLKFLEDVPGLRAPKWYTVDIPFDFGETESKAREIIISNEGPFMCTQIQAYYLVTDADSEHYVQGDVPFLSNALGRTLAPTAFFPTMGWGQLPYFDNLFNVFSSYVNELTGVLVRGRGWNLPDFDIQIEVSGSARYWAGEPIPIASLYGVINPEYTGICGVVQQTDRLVVRAYPTTNTVNLSGVLRVVFHGSQIQGNIDLTQYLGN